MSIPMAIVDFIPVALFFVAALILMRDLYHMMSKGAFALMSGGMIVVFVAGIFKAIWKLLMALDVCDFVALNAAFFPMQSVGFLLAALGVVSMLIFPQKKGEKAALAVAFTSSMPFVAVLVLGTLGVATSLAVLAGKMKKYVPMIIYILYFILMMCMGYLSSRDFSEPAMNWIGEGINTAGQGLFLLATVLLDKAGLAGYELKKKKD